MSAKDRLIAVANSSSFNGIDFIEVASPTELVVHFLNSVPVNAPAPTATITGGDSITDIALKPIQSGDWGTDGNGRILLHLHALATGDFSLYTLTLAGPQIDLILGTSTFSFKAFCPSDFDCATPPAECPPSDLTPPPIDYLSRDFQSFEQALLAYSSLRYPNWVERSEADFGVMMSEILSAVGDELSYLQDRAAAESNLMTATQRRSLTSLARLVDYEPSPPCNASTWLACTVSANGSIPAGARVTAMSPSGASIPFEIGLGIADATQYPVVQAQNYPLPAYWFDDSEDCLAAGATSMWVQGHNLGFLEGARVLIQTDLPGESLRQIVTLTAAGFETVDPIFETNGQPTPVTQLTWGPSDALTRSRDLTRSKVGGNIAPARQGQRFTETFAIGSQPTNAQNAVLAVARYGPNGDADDPGWVFRYPLSESPLGWVGGGDSTNPAAPEVILTRLQADPGGWEFVPSLINSLSEDLVFTIDPVAWQVVARSPIGQPTNWDIAGDSGATIRFGDNVFGASPNEQDLFQLTYRTGLGSAGNVAADTITGLDPSTSGVLVAVRNPVAATGGADAETPTHIRRNAPQAFQAVQYRAVTAADYEAAAETLTFVENAATSFRWTGSWMTVFTEIDPAGGSNISTDEEIEVVELLNRYRLAGYESYAPAPDYVSLDFVIEICAATGWRNSDVEASVLDVLGSSTRPDWATSFFFAARFSFGSPLYRSRLEAAIQGAAGVAGVVRIRYRRRGAFTGFRGLPEVFTPAPTQILRIDNDPSWPERGTIRVVVEGGQ
jgi:hypothetical protein